MGKTIDAVISDDGRNIFKRIGMQIGKFLSDKSKLSKLKEKHTQVYCSCGNEMVGDVDKQKKPLSFIRDVYVKERNVVHYKCSKCEKETFYNFDFPAPILLPLFEGDTIIEEYKKISPN